MSHAEKRGYFSVPCSIDCRGKKGEKKVSGEIKKKFKHKKEMSEIASMEQSLL